MRMNERHVYNVVEYPSNASPSVAGAGKPDAVKPSHYRGDTVMRIIEDFGLGFCLGNVIKYVLRHKYKAGLEDLKKAAWYLNRQIQQMEAK